MREQIDLTEDFTDAIDNHGNYGGDLDRIETRHCASDHYDGIEYEFYGSFVPVRPIIDVVGATEGFAIEQMQYVFDEEPRFQVFVADIRANQPHPAFTEARL